MKVLFRFADKLLAIRTTSRKAIRTNVKKSGWSDDAVRETVLTVGYFNYINRVSLGLGLVGDL